MAAYEIRFIDDANRTYSVERVRCNDVVEAIAKAQELNVASIGAGFEVWHGEKLVHRAGRRG